MELDNLANIIETLEQIPVYAWILLAVVILFIFGDRQKWDLKARFPDNGVRGRNGSTGPGYVEITCYRKKGMVLVIRLSLDNKYQNQPLQIYIGNHMAYDLRPDKNKSAVIRYKGAYNLTKPEPGDKVEVKSNGITILSSAMEQ